MGINSKADVCLNDITVEPAPAPLHWWVQQVSTWEKNVRDRIEAADTTDLEVIKRLAALEAKMNAHLDLSDVVRGIKLSNKLQAYTAAVAPIRRHTDRKLGDWDMMLDRLVRSVNKWHQSRGSSVWQHMVPQTSDEASHAIIHQLAQLS